MLPVNPARLPAMYQDALRQIAAGQFPRAKETLRTILSVKPDLAEARFQMARVLLETGETEQGLTHLDRAAELKPGEPAIWQVYGAAVEKLADPARTTAFLDKARRARIDRKLLLSLQNRLQPKPARSAASIGSAPPAEIERAIAHLQSGRNRDAARVAERLYKAHPRVSIVADILANARAALGQIRGAEQAYRKARELDPNYAETRVNYGRFLVQQGRYDAAVTELRAALRILPDMPSALFYVGIALARQYRFAPAITALKRALVLDSSSVNTRLELAGALLAEHQPEAAEKTLGPVMDKTFPKANNHVLMARALAAQYRNDEAEAAFDRALRAAPGDGFPLAAKAAFLQTLGRFDEAETLFRRAIESDPKAGEYCQNLLVTRKLQPGDPLIAQMEEQFSSTEITEESRMNFGFALAKALEDTKDFARVFTYLRPANDYMSQVGAYDMPRRQEQTQNQIRMFDGFDFLGRDTSDMTGFAPIFVTGLPRSGTTLVEQILASHSTVTGGGETGYAFEEARKIVDASGQTTDAFDLSDGDLECIARNTETRMRDAVPGADRITDKGVQTYQLIGPIRLAMPNARIVVVRRDPRDTLLSIYKNLFQPGRHLYAYNLRQLALYYRCFRDIVDFWRAKTPGWFYEIEYEALIADPEGQSRALVAACGLEWEDQCLSFYENTRRVDTLSVHQVRQPIYSSSTGAWRRYESELGELFDALGEGYLPKDEA